MVSGLLSGRKAQLKEMGSEKGEDGETSSSSDVASEPPSPSESKDQPKEPKTIQLQPGQVCIPESNFFKREV